MTAMKLPQRFSIAPAVDPAATLAAANAEAAKRQPSSKTGKPS